MTTLTASSAKEQFLSLLRKSHDFGEKYTITHNGQPYAILMSTDEYEGLLETLEILQDKRLTKKILKSMDDIKAGRVYSFEEVVGRKQRK